MALSNALYTRSADAAGRGRVLFWLTLTPMNA
jgi:hypothetical protein